MRSAIIALAVACTVLGGTVAAAACKDEVKEFGNRVAAHPKQGDQKTVQKELAKATDLSAYDESGCFNALSRARRAYSAPAADAAAEKPGQPVQPLNQH